MLYCIILFCCVLLCSILFCSVLFYSVLLHLATLRVGLNKYNKDSAYNLPYQNKAVIDQVAYEHQVGLAKNVLLEQQTLRPNLTLDGKKLSTDMIEIYEKTWASGNILGFILNHQYFYLPIVTSHLDPHPR